MTSINCAVFNEALAKELGKNESESDLGFFHRKHSEKQLCFILPKGFPEKANSLLQTLHLSHTVLLYVNSIDAFFGEIVVAINLFEKKSGFVVFSDSADQELFKQVIKGTVVEAFEVIKKEEILDKIGAIELTPKKGNPVIDLDGMFNVRGVGTVAIGFVAQGIVKKFDKLKLFPSKTEVLIKSVQKHDKDVTEAFYGDRVGFAVKGFDADNFSRGMLLSTEDEFSAGKELEIGFEKSSFFKKELEEEMQLHVQCRLQLVGCRVKSLNPLKIEASKEITVRKDEPITLIDINSKPRVIGKGKIINY